MSRFFGFFFPWFHGLQDQVPQSGIKPVTLAMEAQSPNHWTTREFPNRSCFYSKKERDLQNKI